MLKIDNLMPNSKLRRGKHVPTRTQKNSQQQMGMMLEAQDDQRSVPKHLGGPAEQKSVDRLIVPRIRPRSDPGTNLESSMNHIETKKKTRGRLGSPAQPDFTSPQWFCSAKAALCARGHACE